MIPTTPASILIVEDERIVATDLQQTLTGFGYGTAGIASSCEEALARAEEQGPDLVLMDVRIKGDVDGVAAAELLRTRFDIPVVYLTAYADERTIGRAKITEPYGYLLKPVRPEELRSAIEVSLHKHGMEKKLRDRERWFSTMLRSIGDGVIATDNDGRVTFMNTMAEKLTGWPAPEATGRPLSEVFEIVHEATRQPVSNPVTRALLDRAVVALEQDTTLIRRDGAEAAIDDSAAPIVDDKVKVLGAVLVFRDVSEKKQLQANLILSDRMASVGMLASGVAHEINNPLASVMANLDLVAMKVPQLAAAAGSNPDWEETVQELDDARVAAERIRKITLDLRTFSRSPDDRMSLVDLQQLLESTLRMAWNEIRHRARLSKQFGVTPLVWGNESRLGQVFLNVIVNAAQAIKEGRHDQNDITVVTGTSEQGGAFVVVSDTGAGIPATVQSRLFQPFFTTKKPGIGTGLGLALSRRILAEHGGTIAIRSEVGKGTQVRIVLPRPPDDAGVGAVPEDDDTTLELPAPKRGSKS